MRRHLFGPVTAEFSEQFLRDARASGYCKTFSLKESADLTINETDTWTDVLNRCPDKWLPEAVFLWLPYSRIPECLWSAPVPVIGLAADWNVLWHYYRRALRHCDSVVTDLPGAELLKKEGHGRVIAAPLYGLNHAWEADGDADLIRDIDVSFVGNLNPAVQSTRTSWLLRLARHGRRKVAIRTGLFDAEYRTLLRRSRIVFNHSIRGECNARTFEALAAGAMLFSEEGNDEVDRYLRPGKDYVAYNAENFDQLLEHYLDHEEERSAIARSGHERYTEFTFDRLWSNLWVQIDREWPALAESVSQRPVPSHDQLISLACYQVVDAPSAERLASRLGQSLLTNPDRASWHSALAALSERGSAAAVASARRAHECSGRGPGPTAELAEQLAADKAKQGRDSQETIRVAAEGLRVLASYGSAHGADSDFVRPDFGRAHVVWERCGWRNAGRPTLEQSDKQSWARWRLHSVLADLTGELGHFHEAALAHADSPPTRAALGCALARAGRSVEAVSHLSYAFEQNPLDFAAARALFQLLTDLRDESGRRRLARDLRMLVRAAPQVLASEEWFAACPPPGDELASVVIPVFNNVELTRACVESVFRHTRGPCELILIDNGSTDSTPEYLASLKPRDGIVAVRVLTNSYNHGFPSACNKGLAFSSGEYIVFLNNDTVVTHGWLDGLIAWSLCYWPRVGLVGAVTNYAPAPQCVPPAYGADLRGLDAFAQRRRSEFAGKGIEVERVSGFCLLARREVLEKVGGFDERFGVGFFDDDDLGVRVRDAGFKLLVALDVYVHHHGSRTFATLGLEPAKLLADNFEVFRAKWGVERSAGYRAPSLGHVTLQEAPASAAPQQAQETGPGAGGRPRVSLCMIVRNEEHNLPDCLESASGLFDEIVIVDTGSNDRTREVAKVRGANVYEFPWVDDFAAARNASIEHATGDYVFWLDADDRVHPEDKTKLGELFAGLDGANVAYVIKCVCAARTPGESATVVDHVRLFRNRPEHRWKYRVHEQILPAVRSTGAEVRWSDVRVVHVGYQDPALRQRKLQRDLKILQAEYEANPGDPFTLFNLGSVFQELDRCADALTVLRQSLERSHPGDSIVRKLYALIIGCHRRLGQVTEAATALEEGRRLYPQDVELLFMDGVLRRERNDNAGAEACWLQLLNDREASHFASIDAGLRGSKARHNLAVLYLEQERYSEAEAQWRAALSEEPGFVTSWLGLGELYLKRKRWAELAAVINSLEGESKTAQPTEANLLRARMYLARKEFASAKWVLSEMIAACPDSIEPRIIFTHVLLQEDKAPAEAEAALNEVLRIEPGNREAQHNLQVLRQQRASSRRT